MLNQGQWKRQRRNQPEWVQPDITKLPAPLNAPVAQRKPEEYINNKVASLSQQLIQDIFPQQATVERIVFEFKDAFPGTE